MFNISGDKSLTSPDKVLSFKALNQAIPPDAVIIYTSLSPDGLFVLGMDYFSVKGYFEDPTAMTLALRDLVLSILSAITEYNGCSGPEKIIELLTDLSKMIISPLAEKWISKKDNFISRVSGDLSRLPLGALRYRGMYLLLQKQVSQVPSLKA